MLPVTAAMATPNFERCQAPILPRAAALQGRVHVVVAIVLCAGQGDEQFARMEFARVRAHAGRDGPRPPGLELALAGLSYLAQRHLKTSG